MTRIVTIKRAFPSSLLTLALLSLPAEGAPTGWHVPAYDAPLHRWDRGIIYGRAYPPRRHRITSYGPRHRRYRAPLPPRYFSPFGSPPFLVDYRDRNRSGLGYAANRKATNRNKSARQAGARSTKTTTGSLLAKQETADTTRTKTTDGVELPPSGDITVRHLPAGDVLATRSGMT